MKVHMVAAINAALKQEMQKDPSVMCLGEDIGVNGGVFRVTDKLQEEFGKDRVVDTPLAEAGIVGASIGLALGGMKPIPEIQFSGFSYQAFHHIKQHMARFRQRTHNTMHLPMVLRAPCSGGIRALEHHSESPEAFFIHCQGIKVVMPSGPYDAKGLLISAIRDPDPVVFLEPKKIYRSFKEEVPEEEYTLELGKAKLVKEGKDVTIITWGAMLKVVEAAAELCKDVDLEIIDLRTLWPYDMETLVKSTNKTGRVVVVQEATRACSLASDIAANLQERCILKLEAPIERVSAWDIPFPHFALENYFLPNPQRVLKSIRKVREF
ncbi:alpha-ketoacid dehydrogenase subunit beta [Candidatus Woesearchaeota archaeon]|nr:alpha-ketoacid dehydrogenase subunit beta [Candidatus Woesearchaeota archaeon]USN43917.1 MAG: alpha-ketoacid dehydrogenase subunit beta [Candidatus Woesearchaeota archaeon]